MAAHLGIRSILLATGMQPVLEVQPVALSVGQACRLLDYLGRVRGGQQILSHAQPQYRYRLRSKCLPLSFHVQDEFP
jgi:hypothetical protein